MDGRETGTTQSAVEWLRWLAMALGLARLYLVQPPPVSRAAAIGTVLTMAVYNCAISVARRRGWRVAPLALVALVLDFLTCTAYVMLVANDRYSAAYALYIFVGIEAAVLHQTRGAVLFAGAFVTAFAVLDRVRAHVFGFPAEVGSLVFRSSIVLLVALVVGAIASQSQRRRSELAESAARLSAIAATDVLTELPNRREFERRLAVPQSRQFAILAIDVDNLKVVNDGHGHEAGDAALRSIGTALRMGVRDGDVVARSGGDEFTALLPDTSLEEAVRVGEGLRRAMHGIALPHGQARISIGCAAGPAGADAQTVFTQADDALYRAKRKGRDRLEAELAVTERGSQEVRWETLVPSLLREEGMVSVFQPIVSLRDGNVIGYEALGRPSDAPPDLGVEGLFTAADRIGEGRNLDWVCRRAALLGCRGLHPSTAVFVNVGATGFLDPLHGVDQMLLLLRWADRLPSQVVLEITEREAVRDLDRLQTVIEEYRSHGFRFALDDVGTGHSTFEVLSAATPEFIKIAGRLTRRAAEVGPRSTIRALVAFAASSGAQVVAEGVENEATASSMRRLGVDLAQGFMWGIPAAASAWQSWGDLARSG
jgi:diguanylate cyclase (GGDEF)-like protein